MVNLGTVRDLRLRMLVVGLTTGVGGVVLISFYLAELFDLPADAWRGFLAILAFWTAAFFALGQALMHRELAPLVRWLAVEMGRPALPAENAAAFAAAMNFPRRFSGVSWASWTVGGTVLTGHVWLRIPDASPFHLAVLLCAAASGGLISTLFFAVLAKQALRPYREELCRRIPEAGERERMIKRLSLAVKLQLAMGGLALVPVVFAGLLAYAQAARPVEELVALQQERVLARAVAAWPATRSPEVILEAVRRELETLDLGGAAGVLHPGSPTPEELPAALAASLTDAASAIPEGHGRRGNHVLAWRRLPGSAAVLFATTPAERLGGGLSRLRVVIIAVALLWSGTGLLLAWLLARDIDGGSRALREEAQRVSAGDLRSEHVFDAEDEFGDLGRSFERMRGALRETIGRVAETADRVEGAAREMETLGQGIAGASADQVRGIEAATVATDGVTEQVRGIADSSHGLAMSVEDSSSSILEMGAAGEELTLTASALNEKIEGVSASIEETARAVRQVAENVEGLAQAASETSSSMEEMAGSLRDVDANAGETARLSAGVVASAEAGRETVRQTIQGMEAIRSAMEGSQGVLRGLGERAREIGAIVDVIDNIADETNLLALNAAIIAAQAGERGRAFSVVADEIKDLADRVMSSTKEISGLIGSVQQESQNAIGAFERGNQSVLSGVSLSERAGASLEEITRAARESGERIEEIVGAVRGQARAAGQVVALMDLVRSGVEQIRHAGREQERGTEVVMRNATAMRDVAQQVHRTTDEQARGAAQIRRGIEAVREAVERIHRALEEQSTACERAARFMEQVSDRTQSNEEAARRMGEATRGLRGHAEALREDVRRFRL